MSIQSTTSLEAMLERAMGAVMGFLVVFCMAFLLILAVKLISYILKGIGLYTMAKRQGLEYPWLGFIPYARVYLQGELSGDIQLGRKTLKNPGIWMIVLPFVWGFVSWILNSIAWALFGTLLAQSTGSADEFSGVLTLLFLLIVFAALLGLLQRAVTMTLHGLVDYQILGRYGSRNIALVHTFLALLVPLYESILFFVIRNRSCVPGPQGTHGAQRANGAPETYGAQNVNGAPETYGAQNVNGAQETCGTQNVNGAPEAYGAQSVNGAPEAYGAQSVNGAPEVQGVQSADMPQKTQEPWSAAAPENHLQCSADSTDNAEQTPDVQGTPAQQTAETLADATQKQPDDVQSDGVQQEMMHEDSPVPVEHPEIRPSIVSEPTECYQYHEPQGSQNIDEYLNSCKKDESQ